MFDLAYQLRQEDNFLLWWAQHPVQNISQILEAFNRMARACCTVSVLVRPRYLEVDTLLMARF